MSFVVVVLDEGALPRLALGPAHDEAAAEKIRDAVPDAPRQMGLGPHLRQLGRTRRHATPLAQPLQLPPTT
jgi:hypothetical protein